jgi:hypothetical protein
MAEYKDPPKIYNFYLILTKRVLQARIKEHRTFSKAKKTYYHIHRCPVYVKKLLKFEKKYFTPKSTHHLQEKDA